MKTRLPLIVTARIAGSDLEPFDTLRSWHFPPDRNFLSAHLTMFHRLPGEYVGTITEQIAMAVAENGAIDATVSGIRHLGAGVAFTIASSELQDIREGLKASFLSWLGPQDMQTWRPHITIQNKAPKATADKLYREMQAVFHPRRIRITGLDLWRYLDGPWRHEATFWLSGTECSGSVAP